MTENGASFLACRVLDLTQAYSHLCGRVLADFGADVVLVEPPEGDPVRRRGPFFGGSPHRERSLTFWFYNVNKRGITLNLDTADGRELCTRLAKTADIVLESFPPGHMDALGLGYKDLSVLNPRLIYVSISAFGQSGPYADYQAPDIVGQAMGGLMYMAGDPNRPPLRIAFPQTYLHAASEAAVGALLALHARDATGRGQLVDVSAQQSVIWSLMNATVTWDLNKTNVTRQGSERFGSARGTRMRINWPCKDGYVCFRIQSGPTGGLSMKGLVRWMDEEGMAPDYLNLYDFKSVDLRFMPQEEIDLLSEPMAAFFMRHTKAELFSGALERRIILYPISTMQDITRNPQLQARNFFVPVRHSDLDNEVIYPGAAPVINGVRPPVRRPPPLLGQHNEDVFCKELNLSRAQLEQMAGVGAI